MTMVVAVLRVRVASYMTAGDVSPVKARCEWYKQKRGDINRRPLVHPTAYHGIRRDAPAYCDMVALPSQSSPAKARFGSSHSITKRGVGRSSIFGPNCCVKPDLRINAISQMMVWSPA